MGDDTVPSRPARSSRGVPSRPPPVESAPVTTNQPPFDAPATLTQAGPLSRETALAALAQAAALHGDGRLPRRRPAVPARHRLQRRRRSPAAAMVGLGEALHRLDEDGQALGPWEEATRLPENEHTYAGVAQRRRRAGPRRRPAGRDRRLPRGRPAGAAGGQGRDRVAPGLAVEGGRRQPGAAGRYFAQARGDAGFSVAIGVLAVTVDRLADPRLRAARPARSCYRPPRARQGRWSPRASCGGCGP